MTETNKLLLISPGSFYSYSKMISQELEIRNFEVTSIDDMIPVFPINKILRKLNLSLLQWATHKFIVSKISEDKNQYKVIFILNGQGVSLKTINFLKYKYPKAKMIGYCWDSLINNKTPLEWYHVLDNFGLFDPCDGQKYQIKNVPLFSSVSLNSNETIKEFDFSFIGTIHSDRIKLIYNAVKNAQNCKYFIYFYERSIFTVMKNFLRNPKYYIKLRKFIFLTPLPYTQFTRVLSSSYYTLDVSHERQNGITIRCFEANALKTGIITNNKFVLSNTCFNKNNAKVSLEFNDISHLLKQKPLISDFQQARYITDFIDDLFKEKII